MATPKPKRKSGLKRAPAKRTPRKAKPGTRGLSPAECRLDSLPAEAEEVRARVEREGGLDWLLAAIARSAAELVAEGPKAPLRICADPQCGLFFYDKSRNHSRAWCSMEVCGNREKARSFRKRHATA